MFVQRRLAPIELGVALPAGWLVAAWHVRHLLSYSAVLMARALWWGSWQVTQPNAPPLSVLQRLRAQPTPCERTQPGLSGSCSWNSCRSTWQSLHCLIVTASGEAPAGLMMAGVRKAGSNVRRCGCLLARGSARSRWRDRRSRGRADSFPVRGLVTWQNRHFGQATLRGDRVSLKPSRVARVG